MNDFTSLTPHSGLPFGPAHYLVCDYLTAKEVHVVARVCKQFKNGSIHHQTTRPFVKKYFDGLLEEINEYVKGCLSAQAQFQDKINNLEQAQDEVPDMPRRNIHPIKKYMTPIIYLITGLFFLILCLDFCNQKYIGYKRSQLFKIDNIDNSPIPFLVAGLSGGFLLLAYTRKKIIDCNETIIRNSHDSYLRRNDRRLDDNIQAIRKFEAEILSTYKNFLESPEDAQNYLIKVKQLRSDWINRYCKKILAQFDVKKVKALLSHSNPYKIHEVLDPNFFG